MSLERKKICIAATIAFPLVVFMKPHIEMLAQHYDVILVANAKHEELSELLNDHVRLFPIDIARKISIWQDVKSLFQFYMFFRKEKFTLVHSIMPKTALLAMVAAFFSRVPYRVHTFTGQVWANKKGVSRWGLKILDRLIAMCATNLLADSFSQRQFLIDQHIVSEDKLSVLGSGSVCGVDLTRFKPNIKARCEVRSNLNIPVDAVVYLFLGRLNVDKGVLDLAHAFLNIANHNSNVHLLVVGPEESDIGKNLANILAGKEKQFHRIGFTSQPENYMAAADVFCLPSYREGFGSVIIEAAATRVPSIASNIYGLTDAVNDEETGMLHPPKDISAIEVCLLEMLHNEEKRNTMAMRAYNRARDEFSTERVVNEMNLFYKKVFFSS